MPPYFFMYNEFEPLWQWPDQINLGLYAPFSIEKISAQISLARYAEAEASLLALIGIKPDFICEDERALILLIYLRMRQKNYPAVELLFRLLDDQFLPSPLSCWIRGQYCLLRGQSNFALNPKFTWTGEESFPLLAVVHVAERISVHDLDEAQVLLSQNVPVGILDAIRLQASILRSQGKYDAALDTLLPHVHRARNSLPFMTHVLELAIAARRLPVIVPVAREAILVHGEHPDLLNNITAVKLFQRQPSFARRCSLLLQTWSSLGMFGPALVNQICAYEQCGNVDWLDHLHPAIWRQPLANPELTGNLVLSLASYESSRLAGHLSGYVNELRFSSFQQRLEHIKPANDTVRQGASKLKIAWITPDLAPHPVSRFLEHFFAASMGSLCHEHLLVNLVHHGTESKIFEFTDKYDLQVLDIASMTDLDRVHSIRTSSPDVAIDLAGWTGGHFAQGFLARLAPVQVNYLGYFSTSGLPTMDFWLGDNQIFPRPVSEYCTESIWRLDRPFIAWQPAPGLPEAGVDVPECPGGGIRFGSFNHNRKLSDTTLMLWGSILREVCGSRLVLKANAGEDPFTQELLARRMLRAGIDVSRVEWLSLTPSSRDHLLQYRFIDIALDPVPNGGCTTTLEALWMGCPVITLAGKSYVSRMSTAVLRGVGLNEYVSESLEHYKKIAIAMAQDLQGLRSRRDDWRAKVANSPVGDAASLMVSLEHTFSSMMHLKNR